MLLGAVAEEVLVVAFLITRLRSLGWTENRSLLASAVLRGSYHLYQGLGGGGAPPPPPAPPHPAAPRPAPTWTG
ncbi:hypothetical protein AWN90_10035 [Nocardia terpenica]|uniref:CAAX prenyl protease 2/Lysostaphin resistance protein A-like domain-containing protein n=1 Tax=Nocardia terpenica TaxID=455432 RepID=A0A164H6I3_9NOCA|nr:hypothetical protein AWN90_10035 [Nocardia terpenica]